MMENAIKEILEFGFQPDGHTETNSYKIVTANSYPLPGKIVTTGGRQKFKKGNLKITIGKRTVCMYSVKDKKAINMKNFETKYFSSKDINEYIDEFGGE